MSSNDIYNYEYFRKHKNNDSSNLGYLISEWRQSFVEKHLGREEFNNPNRSLVDWGCGGSAFLLRCSSRLPALSRHKLIGVDINPYCVFFATSLGLRAYLPEFFDEFERSNPYATACCAYTLWDVFEHLQDPRGFLRKHAPEHLFMSLPCLDGFYKAFGPTADIQLWKHYRPQEHLWNFTVESLTKFLEDCGYAILEVSFEESKLRKDAVLGDYNIMTIAAKRISL